MIARVDCDGCAKEIVGTLDVPAEVWTALMPLEGTASVGPMEFCSPRCLASWADEVAREKESAGRPKETDDETCSECGSPWEEHAHAIDAGTGLGPQCSFCGEDPAQNSGHCSNEFCPTPPTPPTPEVG